MGQALPSTSTGRVIHLPPRTKKDVSWHHTWRGKIYESSLWAFLVASGATAIWFLTPLHRIRLPF